MPIRDFMVNVNRGFFQSGVTRLVMIGVQLLSQLVCEMNQVSEVVSPSTVHLLTEQPWTHQII